MRPLLLALATSLIFIGCNTTKTITVIKTPPAKAEVTDMILKVPIHLKDKGYSNFKTTVIKKQERLDEFIADIKTQKGWKKKKNFLDTLSIQNIDFTKKSLLIYRMTENSSTIVLAVDVPKTFENHVTVVIGREKPKTVVTDMTHYALAYLVDKKIVDVTFDNGETNSTINMIKDLTAL